MINKAIKSLINSIKKYSATSSCAWESSAISYLVGIDALLKVDKAIYGNTYTHTDIDNLVTDEEALQAVIARVRAFNTAISIGYLEEYLTETSEKVKVSIRFTAESHYVAAYAVELGLTEAA